MKKQLWTVQVKQIRLLGQGGPKGEGLDSFTVSLMEIRTRKNVRIVDDQTLAIGKSKIKLEDAYFNTLTFRGKEDNKKNEPRATGNPKKRGAKNVRSTSPRKKRVGSV